ALQGRIRQGDRALLLYPPGLDFIRAFMGCLYAGVVAVPAYPPRRNRSIERLKSIALDATHAIALTTRPVAENLERSDSGLHIPTLVIASTETPGAVEWREPRIEPDTLAFLQYTSGSTGMPR